MLRAVRASGRETANHLLSTRHPGLTLGKGCILYGRPIISLEPGSQIAVGEAVILTSKGRKTALGVNHPVVLRTLTPTAHLVIGAGTGVSGGSICAAGEVVIGRNCLLGANVVITDTDFHPVHERWRRALPLPAPSSDDAVHLGDDVFVGTGAIILKGSRIGDHAVIGAGAVVSGIVPAEHVVTGSASRRVRPLRISPPL